MKPIKQSRQQVLKDFCSNIYNVIKGMDRYIYYYPDAFAGWRIGTKARLSDENCGNLFYYSKFDISNTKSKPHKICR